jgi:DNA-binding NtrC family response regulator
MIDSNQAMQQLRAGVLRSRGVHVQMARNVMEAELLWVPEFFDLVLLDVRQRSKEAVAFWRTIRREHPRQRMCFLIGPPTYLSSTFADEATAREKVPDWGQGPRLLPAA